MQRILVPVDGSDLSERAVPVAEALAAGQPSRIVLVRVVSPLAFLGTQTSLSPDVYQEIVDSQDDEATAELDRLAAGLRARSICTRTLLLRGAPAASILEAAAEQRADLIVMSTHGRTGLARFGLGSVADVILRESHTPVLMVPSFGANSNELQSPAAADENAEMPKMAARIN